ncbi:unnamed protein product [Schistocephalus solidus]|uniref:Hydrolase_4 domain-containing protein n=1 Tax=Schistocephalus solidus TaxID=70667 RepID=A0A183SPI7_SCHSO|nr:unnamed protein product [Schistocephalus solidus]
MESVREVYTPFIWGFTGRIQTLLRPVFKRARKVNYEECVVLNNRGTCEQKLKTPRTYSASDTEDLSEVISLIQRRYPDAPLTAVGISLGALILFNYISSFGDEVFVEANGVGIGPKRTTGGTKCPLRAGMCISMLWRLGESSKSLERPIDWLLFNLPLTVLLQRIVHRNAEVLSDKFDVPRILRSRSVREFDENLTVDMFGYPSVEEYYNQASPAMKLDTIKTPLLCFVAADDPFVPLNTIPLDAIAQSSHVMLVLTKHGGHIGFLDSLLPTGPNLMDRAAAQFCSAVFENLEELSAAARDQLVTVS